MGSRAGIIARDVEDLAYLQIIPLDTGVHESQLHEIDAETQRDAVAGVPCMHCPCARALDEGVGSILPASCFLRCKYLWSNSSAEEVSDTGGRES